MKRLLAILCIGFTVRASAQTNSAAASETSSQTVQTVVCFRHGEKPADALGQLTCRGLNRALALPNVLLGKFGTPQFIFAPNPTEKADQEKHPGGYFYIRPLATVEPLAIRCGLPVNTQFGLSEIKRLEVELQKPEYRNATIFIAWEHLKLVDFVKAMVNDHGGDPGEVPEWPHKEYDAIYVVKITRSPGHELVTFTIEHENLNDLSDTCPEVGEPARSTALKSTGKNIRTIASNFDYRAIAQRVKAGMDSSQVILALGQPKETKSEKDEIQWFYTYEFFDKLGPAKWATLMIEFKDGKTTREGSWQPVN